MGRIVRTTIVFCSLLLLSGCFETFSLVDADYRPKGKSIAVISGLDSKGNVAVAQEMSDALRKNTRLHVMPHKQASQAIANYPIKIKGPYSYAFLEIEEDYAASDTKKIREIQKKLGVDYLYVIWTPTATTDGSGKMQQFHMIAQLFDNAGKEVGNGKFMAAAGKTNCCLAAKPDDRDRADAVEETCDYVSREIGEKLGMLKQ